MDLLFERYYPHPIEKVWWAITTAGALEQWLMRNDFVPEVGRESVFHFCADGGGGESPVHVTVEEIDPPRFMQWRWRNEAEAGDSTVTFELEPVASGTRLRLRHAGELPAELAWALGSGWPIKFGALGALLER